LELQKIAYDLKNKQSNYLLMETTSHGLHMGRTLGINFKYRLFTNLTKDHLYYHQTMDNYLEAKKILFDTANTDEIDIINVDTDYSVIIANYYNVQVLSYSLDGPAA